MWNKDKKFSDKFITEIKSILGIYLIKEATPEEDMNHNTDLTVVTLHPYRIGCRVRTYQHLEIRNRKNEFTIRSKRNSGNETELSKILSGWGDYFFYGFSNEQETKLERWTLSDLAVFREWYYKYFDVFQEYPGQVFKNVDNSSDFTSFNWAGLPKRFIVGKNWE